MNGWTYIGSFVMAAAGVLVTIGILWGKLNGKVDTQFEVQNKMLDEIKDSLKPLAAVPQLLTETRKDVRSLSMRLNAVEIETARKKVNH